MIDVYCKGCNKKYFKALVFIGAIRCPRCKKVYEYKIIPNLSVNEMYDINLTSDHESKTP
jgi:phage FluMu protein Com